MGITPDRIINKHRKLDDIIPELANLCGIYCFSDLSAKQKDELVSIYHNERQSTVHSILEGLPLNGLTTFDDLERAQEEFTEWARYDIDRMIEEQWEDQFDIQARLDEVALDNRWRNGDLLNRKR